MSPEQEVLCTLRKAGYKAYLVGGAVRDRLLGLESKDVDIATNARPEQVESLFETTIPTGLIYGTVDVRIDEESIQVTTFRKESTYSDGRRPDNVEFKTSLASDLSRRDFTVNALALDENGRIIDYFGGLKDLKDHVLRAIGNPKERFSEDGLRKWRAVRFACTKNFTIEDKTFLAIQDDPNTDNISVERIASEILKILNSDNPDWGFELLQQSGLLSSLLERFGLESGKLKDSLNALDEIECRLAVLIQSFGETFLEKLKLPKKQQKTARLLVKLNECKDHRSFNQIARVFKREELSRYFDFFEKDAATFAKKLINSPVYDRKDLALNGNDLKSLGLKGKNIKEALEDLIDFVYLNPQKNKKEELINFIKERK